MTADIVQAQDEQLTAVARRFGGQAEATARLSQQINRCMQALNQGGWEGRGAKAFFGEMEREIVPAMERLSAALERGEAVTIRIHAIMRPAEDEAARPFREKGLHDIPLGQSGSTSSSDGSAGSPANGIPGAGQNAPSPLRTIIDIVKNISNAADQIVDVVPIPASILMAFGLSSGGTYTGQVIVRAPRWLTELGISGKWLRSAAGLSKNLTHIKASNLAAHLGKGTKTIRGIGELIAIGQGASAVADVWEQRSDEYASFATSRHVSAMSVDAGLALLPVATEVGGSMIGVHVGATAGAAIMGTLGSVIPVAGTAVGVAAGTIIGGAIGGFAGDWLGAKIGEGTVGLVEYFGGREPIIDFVDKTIAQPVAIAIDSATKTIQSLGNQIRLPRLRFSW